MDPGLARVENRLIELTQLLNDTHQDLRRDSAAISADRLEVGGHARPVIRRRRATHGIVQRLTPKPAGDLDGHPHLERRVEEVANLLQAISHQLNVSQLHSIWGVVDAPLLRGIRRQEFGQVEIGSELQGVSPISCEHILDAETKMDVQIWSSVIGALLGAVVGSLGGGFASYFLARDQLKLSRSNADMERKIECYLRLMSSRLAATGGNSPVSNAAKPVFNAALNEIPATFHDAPAVLSAWNDLHTAIRGKGMKADMVVSILDAMAEDLDRGSGDFQANILSPLHIN